MYTEIYNRMGTSTAKSKACVKSKLSRKAKLTPTNCCGVEEAFVITAIAFVVYATLSTGSPVLYTLHALQHACGCFCGFTYIYTLHIHIFTNVI